MKNITFVIIIAVLSILNVSCDKGPMVQPKPVHTVSIQLDSWKTCAKSGDNDDDPLPDIPVLTGKATNSDGSPAVQASVELLALPESGLVDQTVTDGEGTFMFYDVQQGSYKLVVKQEGEVVGTTELLLE